MDTKLTLKLNKLVIDKAKEYASSHKRSLSRMIEDYLRSLTEREISNSKDDIEISPFVKSMRSGIRFPSDFDHKKIYAEHLSEKYK